MEILIVFFRALVPGRVKTRLARSLGDRAALELYAAMLWDLAGELQRGSFETVPNGDNDAERRNAGGDTERGRWVLGYVDADGPTGPFPGARIQAGNTLFERMANAIEDALHTAGARVLLVGSDIPELTLARIEHLFELLHRHDAVLAPSVDGGYYAIGFTRDGYRREAFTATDRRVSEGEAVAEDATTLDIAQRTMNALRAGGVAPAEGPRLRDVDTIEDLLAVLRVPEIDRTSPGFAARARELTQ
jgi:hypothetical protein